MHYRNGREAKNGDKVIQLDSGSAQAVVVGTLIDAVPGNDHCNGVIVIKKDGNVFGQTGACLCDCLHLDDLAAILAEKGLGATDNVVARMGVEPFQNHDLASFTKWYLMDNSKAVKSMRWLLRTAPAITPRVSPDDPRVFDWHQFT